MDKSRTRVAWIRADALAKMLAEVRYWSPYETGGLLLGYRDSRGAVVITTTVGPGPRAQHRRFSFSPDHDAQQAELAQIYEASGRTCTYLGDWHSHPLGLSVPSRTDRRTLLRIAGTVSARQPRPVMGIVTIHGNDATFALWELKQRRCYP